MGKTAVDDVDLTTKLIIDHLNNIKHWVTQQSIMKISQEDNVSTYVLISTITIACKVSMHVDKKKIISQPLTTIQS